MVMSTPIHRRDFVARAVQAGALAGLGDLAFLHGLPPVRADEAKLPAGKVKLSDDIEPLVRLLEETPRDKLLEAVAERIRGGVGYQPLLAAVMLAGVRGIQPRPVGFKFHAVLVINSAHLASLAAPDSDRWLPLLWAMDNFKVSQAKNQQEGGWVMPPAENAKLPAEPEARKRFTEAMDGWDEEGADRATTTLARTAGAEEVIEQFWRYGARDFRDIGHKAIYVANGWRTLQTIGWRHAEPVLRSLAFALLEHEGDNPAKRDGEPDRPGRDNLKRVAQIRAGWRQGKVDARATTDLLAALRTAAPAESSGKVVELLNKEVDPASVWDGLFLRAGELLMQQPGIVGIHCVTSVNALHYGFQHSGNDETRRFLILQAAAFLPMFREIMLKRGGKLREELRIDALEKEEIKSDGAAAVEEIFGDVSKDRVRAARKTLALLDSQPATAEALMTAGRRLVFLKGTDSHDYKFSSAALEDFYHASPSWRNRFLATSMFNLRGAGDRENNLVKRARAALGA
jgi:hypothetical protein